MGKCVAALMLLVAMTVAACGPAQVPPPAPNAKKNTPQANGGSTEKPKGKPYNNEYREAANKAMAAWKDYINVKNAETYAACGTEFYKALTFRSMHVQNGHSSEGLPMYTQLNQAFQDWKKTLGPKGWEENTEYKAAKAEYDKVQQGH